MMLTEEHEQFRAVVRTMVAKHITPIADEVERTDTFPTELIKVFGDMGLLQLSVPEQYGGPGGDLTSICIAREEVALGGSMGLAIVASQNGAVVHCLLAGASEELKQRMLPKFAEGRTITCIAITESDVGSDPATLQTKAVRDGSEWVLNGSKQFITWGNIANYALVFARTNDLPRSKGISAFLVDTNQPGWVVTRSNDKMGQHGIPNNDIVFENLRVPDHMMIGAEGSGFRALMHGLNMNRVTVAALAVGGAQCALNYAIEYAKQRESGGHTVADYQGIQWMIADCATQIEAARLLTYSAARAHDTGAPVAETTRLSSMAKLFATDTANRVTADAVQILGGHGYMREHPVERYMRDAKLLSIYEGTNEIQRNIIAKKVLGR